MPATRVTAADPAVDLVVVGGGLIGLATTAAAAELGLSVALLTVERQGAASRAGAGLLVPHYSGESSRGEVARFMTAARDAYPAYVRWVEERSGASVPFQAAGALELARTAAECAALHDTAPAGAVRLTPGDVTQLEPTLAPTAGGVLHPRDGAVDNVRLTDALTSIVERHHRVRTLSEAAVRIDTRSTSPCVATASGTRLYAPHIVLATGAWTAGIEGLRRPIPVRPVRGQLCTLRTAPLRHVVLGADGYMVSRQSDRTLIGSTMEEVGFEPGTTPAAIDGLRRCAAAMCPAFAREPIIDAWFGFRPATPDLLPILGPDVDDPALIYACGHSRNGILLAPITGTIISAIAAGADPGWDLSPFSIERFGRIGNPVKSC